MIEGGIAMGKINKIILIFILFICSSTNVYAECDFTETNRLNSLAVNVKASYEHFEVEYKSYTPLDGATQEEIENYVVKVLNFKIHIANITKELYVTVTDSVTKNTKTYNYSDTKNGEITFIQDDLTQVYNYTINIYSSNETNCPDTKLYTMYLQTPYFNRLSEYELCEGIEEFYLCHEFLNVKSVSLDEFESLSRSYRNNKIDKNGEKTEQEKTENNSISNFLKNHKILVVILSVVIIIVIILLIILIAKKNRGKKNEEF